MQAYVTHVGTVQGTEDDWQPPPHKPALTAWLPVDAPPQDETERHVRPVVTTPFEMVLAWAQLPSGWPLDGSLHEGLVAVTWHWYETQGGG